MNIFAMCELAEPLGSASSWKHVRALVIGNLVLKESHLVEANLYFLLVSTPEEMWIEETCSKKNFGIFSPDYL